MVTRFQASWESFSLSRSTGLEEFLRGRALRGSGGAGRGRQGSRGPRDGLWQRVRQEIRGGVRRPVRRADCHRAPARQAGAWRPMGSPGRIGRRDQEPVHQGFRDHPPRPSPGPFRGGCPNGECVKLEKSIAGSLLALLAEELDGSEALCCDRASHETSMKKAA